MTGQIVTLVELFILKANFAESSSDEVLTTNNGTHLCNGEMIVCPHVCITLQFCQPWFYTDEMAERWEVGSDESKQQ